MNKFIILIAFLFSFSLYADRPIVAPTGDLYLSASDDVYTDKQFGIKTGTPAYSLDVYSNDADWMAQFDQDNASGLGVLVNADSSNTSTAALLRIANASNNAFDLLSKGDLTISSGSSTTGPTLTLSSTPTSSGDIVGAIDFYDLSATAAVGSRIRGETQGASYSHDLVFYTNSNTASGGTTNLAERMRIDSTGKVYSASGSSSVFYDTWTDLITFNNDYAMYKVHVWIELNDTAYTATVTVINNGTSNIAFVDQNNGSSLTLLAVGKVLRAKHLSSGFTRAIKYTFLKM